MDSNQPSARRILVLGSAAPARSVVGYLWDKLPQSLNVSDYDSVILNFVPLLDPALAESSKSLPQMVQFTRLIFSRGSEIIAIGSPDLSISIGPYGSIPVTWWLPFFPKIVSETGEAVQDVEPEFRSYFQHVKKWRFHTQRTFEETIDLAAYLNPVFPQASTLTVKMTPIAQTRFQMPIAFEIRFKALGFDTKGNSNLSGESGPIIWLPAPTEISPEEAIQLIVRERYGVALEQVAPGWAQSYTLPRQVPIEAEISRITQEMEVLRRNLAVAREALQNATRFQKLLYEQGKDGLEPVVRDAFRELQATVQDPQQQGREDGRLVDPLGRKGMLEIKGRTGSLALKDVRQLHDWVNAAIFEEEWQGKGILVANMYCATPLGQREAPFPDNCVATAKRLGICLMTSTQLFRALQEHQEQKLEVAAFWETIFNTDGVCNLPELEAMTG